MLRRSLLELSHRRLSIRRVPRQISCQVPSFVCPQRDFSSSTQQNASPGSGSASKPSGSGGNLSKVIIGSVAIGTIIMGAYSTGYLDHIFVKMPPNSSDSVKDGAHKDNQPMPEDGKGPHHTQIVSETPSHTGEGVDSSSSHVDTTEKPTESQSQLDLVEDSNKHNGEDPLAAISTSDVARGEVDRRAEDKESPAFSLSKEIAEDQDLKSKKSIEGGTAIEGHGNKTTMEQHEEAEKTPQLSKENVVSQDDNMEQNLQGEPRPNDQVKDSLGHAQAAQQTPSSLLDAYYLRDDAGESASTSLGGHMSPDARHSSSKEVSPDAYVSEDGKLILDFLQAIHAAEQRQAELDAHMFAEEKRMMKSKYEKELKDARARELMYAEEAAMLEKELQKERAKAAAALKSFLEKAEERLKMELEQKEREAETKLKEVEESAKAELAASIAREKAAHIEKMAEANLNCMISDKGSWAIFTERFNRY